MSGITDPTEEYFKDGLWAWVTDQWKKLVATADGELLVSGTLSILPHALLDGSVHNDTLAGAPVEGDVIVGIDQGAGVIKWQRLAAGSVGQVLAVQADGSLAWAAPPEAGSMNTEQRVFHSNLCSSTVGIVLTSNKAYFCYVGKTVVAMTPKYVEFCVVTVGAGAQTAEVGIFSTPAAPGKANQTLTKIEATGTLSALNTLYDGHNTNPFSTLVPAGTHLWAGMRTAMATTQPKMAGLFHDYEECNVLSTPVAGALTAAGPWVGALIVEGNTDQAPDLRITLD